MKKSILSLTLACLVAVGLQPAAHAASSAQLIFPTPPVAGSVSKAFTLTSTIDVYPTDPKRALGSLVIGVKFDALRWGVNASCSGANIAASSCPFESLSVTPLATGVKIPVATTLIRDWSPEGYLINVPNGYFKLGDKVEAIFKPSAFTIPLEGGNAVPYFRVGWVQIIAEGDCMVGCNGIQGYVTGDATVIPAGKDSIPATPGTPSSSDGVVINAPPYTNYAPQVSWPPLTSGGIPVSYEVESYPTGATCTATYPARSCAPVGMVAGLENQFRVRAINTSGTSAWSEWSPVAISATTKPGNTPPPTPIAANGSAVVTPSLNTVGDPARMYRVLAYAGSTYAGQCNIYPPETSCVIGGLTNGTAYNFRQIAFNGAGMSAYSGSSAEVTPLDSLVVPPAVPVAPVKVAGKTGINMTFTAPTSGAVPFTYTVTSSPVGLTCVVTGLTAKCSGGRENVAYRFKIKATNLIGASSSVESLPMYLPVNLNADVAPIEEDGNLPSKAIDSTGAFVETNDKTFLLSWDKVNGKLGSKATGIYTGYIQAVATFKVGEVTYTCSTVFGTLKAMPMKTAAQKTASMKSKTFTGKQFCIDKIKMDAKTLAPKGGMTSANFKKIKSMSKTSAELAKEKSALAALKNFTGEVRIQVTRYRAWPTTMVNIGDHNSKGGKIPFLVRNTKVTLG